MPVQSLDALRARVATAAGVALLLPFVLPPSKVQASASVSPYCAPWDAADGPCPAPEDAVAQVGSCVVTPTSEGVYDDESSECCYDAERSCDDYAPSPCCYGRPYIGEHDEHAVADAVGTPGWLAPASAPDLGLLTDAQRDRLARHWTAAGLAEHSSVAGFARVVLDLVACGAPAELVLRAQHAGIDESNHARLCFALASAYAGRPIGPGPLSMGTSAPIRADIVALAVSTAVEGCVGETVGAHVAAVLRDRASDPAVREALDRIAREEAEHAALAWGTLRWAMEVDGDRVAVALRGAFTPPTSAFGDGGAHDPPVADHGLVVDEELRTEIHAVMTRVVWPAAEALLGRGAVSDGSRPPAPAPPGPR
jgi:hypothetical protein